MGRTEQWVGEAKSIGPMRCSSGSRCEEGLRGQTTGPRCSWTRTLDFIPDAMGSQSKILGKAVEWTTLLLEKNDYCVFPMAVSVTILNLSVRQEESLFLEPTFPSTLSWPHPCREHAGILVYAIYMRDFSLGQGYK